MSVTKCHYFYEPNRDMILLNLSQLKACTCGFLYKHYFWAATRKMHFVILKLAWIGETVGVIDKHIIAHLIQRNAQKI